MESKLIETLSQLHEALDRVYADIETFCRECKDPDCMGHIWLIDQEVESLYNKGVPLVQINKGPTFIDSFKRDNEGTIDFSVTSPSCSQLCENRRCGIHDHRPLVCRLYPLGIETQQQNGRTVWALHRDCHYTRTMEERGDLPLLEEQLLIKKISPRLEEEIVSAYCAVDAISHYPAGENNYHILKEVNLVKM